MVFSTQHKLWRACSAERSLGTTRHVANNLLHASGTWPSSPSTCGESRLLHKKRRWQKGWILLRQHFTSRLTPLSSYRCPNVFSASYCPWQRSHRIVQKFDVSTLGAGVLPSQRSPEPMAFKTHTSITALALGRAAASFVCAARSMSSPLCSHSVCQGSVTYPVCRPQHLR